MFHIYIVHIINMSTAEIKSFTFKKKKYCLYHGKNWEVCHCPIYSNYINWYFNDVMNIYKQCPKAFHEYMLEWSEEGETIFGKLQKQPMWCLTNQVSSNYKDNTHYFVVEPSTNYYSNRLVILDPYYQRLYFTEQALKSYIKHCVNEEPIRSVDITKVNQVQYQNFVKSSFL